MEKLSQKIILLEDEAIIPKILDGEVALFEVLIRRYNPLLYKIARNYGLNHEDAEDTMQETYVAAYTQLKNFRHEASFKTWISRIQVHKCYHKLNYGAAKYESQSGELMTENASPVHPTGQDTEKTVANKELGRILERSLQHLPLPYRTVFLLREIEGFSVAETAELLDISPVNVKVRANRARAMLQKELEQFYSSAELYEFHLDYCDKMVKRVFEIIAHTELYGSENVY
jgi:RNA polymerase sigma factor (sigma-70 family)